MTDANSAGDPPPVGESVRVSVENLGGIDRATVTIEAGVTVLAGENATNRTSFLRSLAAAFGGEASAVGLKSDAEAGRVELVTDETTYTRAYTEAGIDPAESAPMCADSALVDTFVAIDERNPARRAIRGGGEDLRDLLMAPVDTASIRAEIRERQAERSELERERDRIESRTAELPALEERRAEIQEELASVTADIESIEAELEDAGSRGEASEAEKRYAEQNEIRESIAEAERAIERQREAVSDLESKRSELQADLDGLSVAGAELESIREDLAELRRRKRELESFTNDVAAVIDLNEDLLADEYEAMAVGEDVTAALDPSSQTIECWTCGTAVPRKRVGDRLDSLRGLLEEKRAEREAVLDRIDDLADRADEIERDRRRKQQLQSELADVEEELDLRRDRIADRRETLEAHRRELEALESRIEDARTDAAGELAETYTELSELEYERGRLTEERSRVASEIETLERLGTEERPRVEGRLDTIASEMAELRDRVRTLEESVIETFDTHVNELLDRLAYHNLERVWLERRTGTGSPADGDSTFVLHVVRTGPDGAVYEDTVDTLSESERELIGIVIALSGYLVHDVVDRVPFVLLDSVESIDAERLGRILEYVGDRVPYLLAAVLPEEAAALPATEARITADELGQG